MSRVLIWLLAFSILLPASAQLPGPAPGGGNTSDQPATLTNKTIDGDLNTITDLANSAIKTAAAIDAAKIANGSVSSTEFQYLDGVTSAVQTQINEKMPLAKSLVILNAGNTRASTNTNNIIYATLTDSGNDLTVTHSATLGSYVTCATAGVYFVNYMGRLASNSSVYLVQRSSLTNTPATSDIRAATSSTTSDPYLTGGAIINCAANDIVWMHYSVNPSTTGQGDNANQFQMFGPF